MEKISPAVSFGHQQVSPAEKRKLVQEHFNTVASRYDLTNTLLSFGQQLLWKRQAVKMLHLQPGEKVLDVCGGTADLSLLAARFVLPSGQVLVYDFNRAMLEIGKRRLNGPVWQIWYCVCKGTPKRLLCLTTALQRLWWVLVSAILSQWNRVSEKCFGC